jgi:hypothetical protein
MSSLCHCVSYLLARRGSRHVESRSRQAAKRAIPKTHLSTATVVQALGARLSPALGALVLKNFLAT